MADILHQVNIESSTDQVFTALSTVEGLSGWWTSTTTGTSELGETIDFRFGDHVTSMKVEALEPESQVTWRCISQHPRWVGTQVSFDLAENDGKTLVRFGHREWSEADDFFAHCSTKWATFLLSLKHFVESGQGRPFPNDQPI